MELQFPQSSHHSGLRMMLRNPHPNKERHGDCGTRAICLAYDLDYKEVWDRATYYKRRDSYYYDQWGQRRNSMRSADWGLSKQDLLATLRYFDLDVTYVSLTGYDNKDKSTWLYFNQNNLPKTFISHIPSHCVAVRDGAIWDTYDSRGKRPRKLRGYVCLKTDRLPNH